MRCAECGSFLADGECPNGHPQSDPREHVARELPDQDQKNRNIGGFGQYTTYELDGETYPAMWVGRDRVVVFGPGENGHVGVYTVKEESDGS